MRIWPLDPKTYVAHALHREERAWPEANCYVDLWIEVLHAAGFDPVPAMAFTLASDFEGDQWTFFKFPLGDLYELYGVDTQELSIWKSPALHAHEQVSRGRVVLMEVDSYYLPDVAGTSYRAEHAKTTIGIQDIDLEARRCGYFHNAGYYTLEGADYVGLFRVESPWTIADDHLLPYTEFAKLDRAKRLSDQDLAARAMAQARVHLARRPAENPFARYRPRFAADVEALKAEPLAAFHLYAFASIRQFGANFELAAAFLRWLGRHGAADLEPAAAELERIAQTAKSLQFKIARAVNSKKSVDFSAMMDELERSWETGMGSLLERLA
jgi:hypothetical protein